MPSGLLSLLRLAALGAVLTATFAGCASVDSARPSASSPSVSGPAPAGGHAVGDPATASATSAAIAVASTVPDPEGDAARFAASTTPPAPSLALPREPGPVAVDGLEQLLRDRTVARPLGDAEAFSRDTTAPPAPGDLWDRIRAGFAMPELDSPLVEQRTRWYLARPDLLAQMLARGAPYLHFIVEEVERRGLPTELALLPFVESAMNPTALSHASAAGLWQFIPATGRRFDLSQDWWVDQRRDVVDSTRAALDYLQEVHAMHGDDWFLALASYNWGENAVARAVAYNRARGRPTGYEHLRMPTETRHYVPKLLALKRIVADAATLGVELPPVADAPYFVSIEHPVPMDLKLAAHFAEMSVEDFVALNPAHNRPVIAASRHNEIRLPVDRVATFLEAAERHAQQRRPFVSWKPHTLANGETIESIAERTGSTAAEIRRANGLPANRRLRPGSRILVPGGRVADASYVESFDAPHLLWQPPPSKARSRARRGPSAASTRSRSVAAERRTRPTSAVRAKGSTRNATPGRAPAARRTVAPAPKKATRPSAQGTSRQRASRPPARR